MRLTRSSVIRKSVKNITNSELPTGHGNEQVVGLVVSIGPNGPKEHLEERELSSVIWVTYSGLASQISSTRFLEAYPVNSEEDLVKPRFAVATMSNPFP